MLTGTSCSDPSQKKPYVSTTDEMSNVEDVDDDDCVMTSGRKRAIIISSDEEVETDNTLLAADLEPVSFSAWLIYAFCNWSPRQWLWPTVAKFYKIIFAE